MIIGSARAAKCTIKISLSAFSAATTNFFLSMISNFLVIGKAFADVQILQTNFRSVNRMSTLLKVRKSIPSTISRLILANKKVFWKNWTLLSLSLIKQSAMTILKMSRWDPSIFCASTSIFLVRKPNFVVQAR